MRHFCVIFRQCVLLTFFEPIVRLDVQWSSQSIHGSRQILEANDVNFVSGLNGKSLSNVATHQIGCLNFNYPWKRPQKRPKGNQTYKGLSALVSM